MKTLFMFDLMGEEIFFFEAEGDYSHLNKVFINQGLDEDKENEVFSLVFKDNEVNVTKLNTPTKDWDVFVHTGFLP